MSIPSSTVDLARRVGAIGSDPTRTHARALRTLLEQLEDLSKARVELVARVDRMTASDDITQRVARAASAMEQWVNVQPAMFEDILDEELSKYDRFRVQLEENGQKQEAFLQSLQARAGGSFFDKTSSHLRVVIVQERHALFRQSRKEDAAVKERELALQSLDLAYHKYREIVRNLEEGQKVRLLRPRRSHGSSRADILSGLAALRQFYNEFSALLSEFRALCKDYAAARGQEARYAL